MAFSPSPFPRECSVLMVPKDLLTHPNLIHIGCNFSFPFKLDCSIYAIIYFWQYVYLYFYFSFLSQIENTQYVDVPFSCVFSFIGDSKGLAGKASKYPCTCISIWPTRPFSAFFGRVIRTIKGICIRLERPFFMGWLDKCRDSIFLRIFLQGSFKTAKQWDIVQILCETEGSLVMFIMLTPDN